MGSILYAKNNIFKIIRTILIIVAIINIYIINEAFANNKTDKYHSLQVTIDIIDPNKGINNKISNNTQEMNTLVEIIKKDLLIFHATSEPKLTKHRIENLHDRAEQEILSNLRSFGYYHAKVTNGSLNESGHHKWIANYQINMGAPTKIKQINLQLLGEANKFLFKKIQLITNKILIINQRLTHDNYEKTKQLILTKLHDYGFLNAQFITSKIEINLQDYSANIVFVVDSNQQYYLGDVTFESDLYEHNFLYNYVPFKKHDLYSTKLLIQLKNNLLNSGLFSKVRIDTEDLSKSKDNIIPITARITAKPANKYTGSLGFGTDTGIRGNLGYLRRRKSKPGHTIGINVIGAKIRKTVIADYSLLGKNPTVDKYNLGLTAAEGHVKERFNKNLEIYAQKSKKYDNRQQFWKLGALTEIFKELPASEKKHAKFLMPSMGLTWIYPMTDVSCHGYNCIATNDETDQNDDIDQNQSIFGNKISLNSKIATKSIFSSTNLLQLTVNEKWIQPILFDLRLIFKGTISATFINDINKLPLSLRFFAGGDNSVRGFAYNSLGPSAQDASGNKGVVGGKHLFFTSLEIEKPIPKYQQISVAWFIDAGNALNSFEKFTTNKLAIGTGFGIGYITPIGAIKAYLAKPVKHLNFEDAANKHVRFHLTFGTDL